MNQPQRSNLFEELPAAIRRLGSGGVGVLGLGCRWHAKPRRWRLTRRSSRSPKQPED
jgi:hypothetical protein